MRRIVLFSCAVAIAASASAQTPAKTPAPHPETAKPSSTARPATTGTAGSSLPAGVPRIAHGPMKAAFSLKYEDIKIGTGAAAEPNKIYKVFYTGYLGANGRPDDGHKFDSSDDHRQPIVENGKPVMGEDGKPKLGAPEPLDFPQGFGRLIPGFDQGFEGMRIGGKRRLFIPWQLAYGAHGRPGPDAAHPGIPPKSDLIFDVELVDVTDLQMPPNHPGMGVRPMPGGMPPHPGTPLPPGHPQTAPTTPNQSAPGQPASGQAPPAGSTVPPSAGAAPAQPSTPPQPETPPSPPPSSTPPQSK